MFKKLKKFLSWCCIFLLVGVATVCGTLAYEGMTEDQFIINKDHRIGVQLLRQKTNETNEYVEMAEDPVLMPLSDGYTENIICVKNDGNIDTYNRVLIAVPAHLDDSLDLIKGENWELKKTLYNQDCEGETCNVYIFALSGKLKASTTSAPAILGVRVNAALEQINDDYILNGKIYDYSEGLQLKVKAQAVQSAFLQSMEDAFSKAILSDNPWATRTVSDNTVTATDIRNVLSALPNGTKINVSTSVSNVIFGERSEYLDIAETCYSQPVNSDNPNGPRAYYQASVDSENVTTWSIYILSDDVIYLSGNCKDLFLKMAALRKVDTSFLDTSEVTNMHGMFQGCSNLESVDVSKWDMSNVTSTAQMFYHCSKIDNLDVSKWNTSSITNMSQMFNSCQKLSYLDTSNWDMSKVTGSYNYMFHNCNNLTAVDVDGWVTKDTKSISFMFLGCNKLETIDVSSWDTSGVTAMDNAFNGCSSVKVLDVSKWNTSNVTTTWQMFQNCSSLTNLNLTGWKTANVTNMANMFHSCSGLTELDLSSFNVELVTDSENMYNGCRNLKTIYVSADAGWDALAVSQAQKIMFAGCSNLVGGKGTKCNSQYGSYARIDGGEQAPGYFTQKN